MKAPFNRLTIIGLGLIGSSIARAAHKEGLASTIVGVDSNEVSLLFARKEGFIHQTSMNAAHAVTGSDIVIIATPTHLLAEICEAIAPHLSPGTLVMDTSSVKHLPLSIMHQYLPAHVVIVPAHPFAGSEQSGVTAGREDLFAKKRIIITPSEPLTQEQLKRVNEFWQALGGRVEAMPAEMHDTIYGYISHLPQLIAFAVRPLMHATMVDLDASETLTRFMRISNSDIGLWCGVFLLNRDVMISATNRYLDVVVHIHKELASAPDATPSENSHSARLGLFPRIVASCLITTVMEAEKKAGVAFLRFSGTGFADFTHPTNTTPDADIEQISHHYLQMAELLTELERRLRAIIAALEAEDAGLLASVLQ